jgi:hypothetical protein
MAASGRGAAGLAALVLATMRRPSTARGHGSARTARPAGLDERFASARARLRPRQPRAAHRRTRRYARAQHNGKLAMRAPV